MADCPGVLNLADMADGGLARARVPGGRLTPGQARAIADAAERLGSGVVDLTNRANLQIRGLHIDAGAPLAEALDAAGLLVEGPADRRRNILVDPFCGLDPSERADLRPLGAALERALRAAPWIGELSPKFAFVLDGGGAAGVAATPSDVALLAIDSEHVALLLGRGSAAVVVQASHASDAALAVAHAAAACGPGARARDLDGAALAQAIAERFGGCVTCAPARPAAVTARYGVVPTRRPDSVALSIPVAVGRIDPAKLRWLARTAEEEGDGALVLAPWSAIVLAGVDPVRAEMLLARSVDAGFPPAAVAARLAVVACAGAPGCVRAWEPAKAAAAAVLALAAAEPWRLPETPMRLHLSGCPKGCAGSAPSDLLLLGSSDASGWTLHREATPRMAGPAFGRSPEADPRTILELLRPQNR